MMERITSAEVGLILILEFVNLLDCVTTEIGVRRGAFEINPVTRKLIESVGLRLHSVIKMMIVFSVGLIAAFILKDRWCFTALSIGICLFTIAVINNLLQMHIAKAQKRL